MVEFSGVGIEAWEGYKSKSPELPYSYTQKNLNSPSTTITMFEFNIFQIVFCIVSVIILSPPFTLVDMVAIWCVINCQDLELFLARNSKLMNYSSLILHSNFDSYS